MDALTIARLNGRGNGQFVKKTARRQKKPLSDHTEEHPDAKVGTTIADGARLLVDCVIAENILTNHAFAGQRSLDLANMRAHSLDMQRGLFRPGSQLIFAQLPDGKLILVNGYHRIRAVIDVEAIVEFQVMIEPVADMAEVRDLYCSIDTNMRKRTDGEIGRAAGLSEGIGVQPGIITNALAAVATIASGLRVVKTIDRPVEVVTAYGRKDAVKEWAAELRIYAGILGKASQKMKARLITQSMMAIALVTLRHQPEAAIDFWTGVAENDGLRKGDPRKALVGLLLEGSHRGQVDAGLKYASIAWNAWFQGRRLQILRIYDTTECQPIGTPFGPAPKRKYTRKNVNA